MTDGPISIAVLASARGSNFQAILNAIAAGKLNARVKVLIVDREDIGAVEIAQSHQVPIVVVPPENLKGLSQSERNEARDRHEQRILESLEPFQPRFLVLAGYLRIFHRRLIDAFRVESGYSRIVNIHPSLLPAFPGMDGYRQAFEYGCTMAGATVHLVDYGIDQGPICAQKAFSIQDCQSVQEVEERGLKIEHELYSQTLSWVLTERFRLEMREPTLSQGQDQKLKQKRRHCVRQT